ncbi:hypothetical protein GCM10011611_31070 [Aliidongia dinghuensis]|uniref:DUF7336 domain-containing protein n=2 Tax=Aliidongia dinghuensis TaxID=1867774 RepID=A0A8J3E3Y9_9PROT|nr:hypothetical protein GCM10011611_31070 [Aliidongia dinghuensis]
MEHTDYFDEKAIGTYSDLELAKATIEQLKDLVGFVDYPDGFRIYECELDKPGWTDGFDPTKPPEEPWHHAGQIGRRVEF